MSLAYTLLISEHLFSILSLLLASSNCKLLTLSIFRQSRKRMASITSFPFPFPFSPPAIPKRTLAAKSRFFNCSHSSFSSIVPPSLISSSFQRRVGEVACSTTPFMGRVGLQWRDGNMSLLSFCGGNDSPDNSDSSSQVLSALLPFVVALTALAALSYPSTFTWFALSPSLTRLVL